MMGKSKTLVQTFGKLVSRFVVQKKKDEQRVALANRRHSPSTANERADVCISLRPNGSPYDMTNVEPMVFDDEYVLNMHGYALHSCIGEGSFGKVYKVSDRRNREFRAVKVVKCPHTGFESPRNAKFSTRELDALQKLKHNHIVNVFEDFQYGSKHFIVMEFVENGNLNSFMSVNRLFPHPEKRRQVFHQLATAVKYCHDNNIAHRDIKLDNVLLDRHNHVRLCDFGFSIPWTEDLTRREVDLCSTFCGTLDYVAPEVLERRSYDPRAADIWSLGVILYALLCLEMPFESKGNSPKKLLRYQKSRKIRKKILKKAPPEERPCVNITVLCMLEPDVRMRATMDDVLSCDWLRGQEYRPITSEHYVREFLPELSKLELEELLQLSSPKKSKLIFTNPYR